ncbi:Hypothetical predicted protein [Olea europaea subsp. europaea]|uniref:Beta-Casp domain-containing protein n=1 Tax=Olea europaea subsp. europaea TaxID=158383 RepID=A0A8S0RL77_OLEEU|nr:Hypothetical predicted protein [Olea europaea subsp. europaea]
MEFTCLSEGRGFYFPPCHILDICGFRVLLDCPMDLSSLTMFMPVPTDSFTMCNGEITSRSCQRSMDLDSNENKRRKINKPFDESSLIRAEPRYKIIKNLLLWDVSSIDVVLISSPMGILGLPFLTCNKDFSAKVYATEAAARFGQLMMEDLVTMHKEFRQVYGSEGSVSPQWMKWEELELLPSELKEIALGKDGSELAGWMSLYSAADVKDCMQKIQSLKYAEEVFYNGTLIIKAFASGLEIGTCNWSIICPKGSIAYLSSSVLTSATAMCLDYTSLQRNDVIIYADFTPCHASNKSSDDNNGPSTADPNLSVGNVDWEAIADDYQEMEKLDFICSCSMDSIKAGGSVLIPVGRIGMVLQLLERIALCLESQNLKFPIFIVSSVAEELMAYTNVIPEWLNKQRQDRLYSGQQLFNHVKLLNDKRLQLFPAIHSLKLLTNWKEPCIVFCPHWSLRLGPVVHLLRRWCRDENSILVMEEGVDSNLALLPFRPMKMKVLQCSFLSGIELQFSQHLLKTLQPRHVLFPEKLRQHVDLPKNLFSSSYYSEDETLNVPNLEENSELDIAVDLALQLHYTTLKQENIRVARLKGELALEQGKYRLLLGNDQVVSSQVRSAVHLGRIELDVLLTELRKNGLNITVEEIMSADGLHKTSLVHVLEPQKATIEITKAQTLICTANNDLACQISEVVSSLLDCI